MSDAIQKGVDLAFDNLNKLIRNGSWHSYTKIWNVGHPSVTDIFEDDVLIEEKVDGSQFSFGIFDGVVRIRSKGVEMDVDTPEKMFAKAAETVRELAPLLRNGWTYRAEYLQKPKHNTLAYDRAPNKNLIIFDINTNQEVYLSYAEKKEECDRLGLEIVPVLYEGKVTKVENLIELMNRISVLGGQKIEGIVIKNYKKFGPDKKALMAKHVSEEFKEVHRGDWKDRHQTQGDVIDVLIATLRTPARWEKAVQHLKERGQLTNSPKDIGPLMDEIYKDILEEEREYIYKQLMAAAENRIGRGVVKGFAQWYKDKLLNSQFDNKAE